MSVEMLIQSKGSYVGVFDLGSPANQYGTYERYLRRAVLAAEAQGDARAAILHFNGYWANLASKGALYAWTVLFVGVYKATIELVQRAADHPWTSGPSRGFIGRNLRPLVCPTGQVTIASLSDLGDPHLSAILTVEPGTYFVTLEVDENEEAKHAFLEAIPRYPSTDGPDWRLRLAVGD